MDAGLGDEKEAGQEFWQTWIEFGGKGDLIQNFYLLPCNELRNWLNTK